MSGFRTWVRSGTPWIWLTAGAVAVCLVMVIGVIGLIAGRGLGHFWPATLEELHYVEPGGERVVLLGRIVETAETGAARLREQGWALGPEVVAARRLLIGTGNRDLGGNDFRWLVEAGVEQRRRPPDAVSIERTEWGHFYGYVVALEENGTALPLAGEALWQEIEARLARRRALADRIEEVEKGAIGAVNYAMEGLRLRERGLALRGADDADARAAIAAERAALQTRYDGLLGELAALQTEIGRDALRVRTAAGEEAVVPLAGIIRVQRPNAMSLPARVQAYLASLGDFLMEAPREANTEGGIFPAIFGTVLMVLIMSVVVTPFGVVAAVYLREYARQGPVTRTIRIAVNNLAGVPSVVYGVFGLGFFVYFLGGNVDRLFFPEALPAPTFGTPGVLWASLTLALLTVPVVIVATEEGLSRIPIAIREGSLALGATKAETLFRTVLPMATPAMMTGLILAVARAAGEVAPLMMVGVVKLAPALPVDGNAPFVHLDRKFMHLGFHIYDVGFQSPNVDAARPLVYATALLLVVIIVALNLAAIRIRNRLREKYSAADQ